jgi:hypothetical protein
MPHAVIKRSFIEIESRIYYIRTNSNNSLIGDITLEFLFNNLNDPKYNSSLNFIFWVTNKETPHITPELKPKYEHYISQFIDALKDKLKLDTSNHFGLTKFMIEIIL